MKTYLVWKDGEEVEVGWFGMMLDHFRLFWKTCKQTDWKHYFKGNGPGEVVYKHFTGFRELQNQQAYNAQWLTAVKGGIRLPEGNFYYRSITEYELDVCVQKNWSELVMIKMGITYLTPLERND